MGAYTFQDWRDGKSFPDGFDCADAVRDGWTRENLDAFMRDRVRPWVARPAEKPASERNPPAGHNPQPEPSTPSSEPERGPEPDPEPEPPSVEVIEDDGDDAPAVMDDGYPNYIPSNLGRKAWGIHPWCDHPLRRWVYLTADGVFYNIETGETMSKTAFDTAMPPATPFVEVETEKGSKVTKMAPSKTVIERMAGHVVTGVMYRPDVAGGLFFEWERMKWVNEYLENSVPEPVADWENHDAWKLCCGHIHKTIPDGADMIIKWMAHNVQFPGRKILWSPVIIGPEGTGKTVIGRMLKAAMGRKNVLDIGPEALFSDFTGWAEGACVRVLEEIRIHGERRTAVMNKLKPYITNETVEVVRKGKDGKEILNVTNYIALTNFPDALALTEGDRRWGVWKVKFKDRAAMLAEFGDPKGDYWTALWDAINNDGGVIRSWLLSVDLSDFHRANAPAVTDAKRDMISMSQTAAMADVAEAIALGGEGVNENVIAVDCLNEIIKSIGGKTLATSALSSVMREMEWVSGGVVRWNGKVRRLYYRAEFADGATGKALTDKMRRALDAAYDPAVLSETPSLDDPAVLSETPSLDDPAVLSETPSLDENW